MNIAVCDDEKEIRLEIRKYILRMYPKAAVTLFESGEELLKARGEPDIIFLDIKMNGADGMKTARKLRENGCGAAIVFVTALEEYVYQAFDVGAFNYILKPIQPARFYEVLLKAASRGEAAANADKGRSILIKNGREREKIYFCDITYAEIFDRRIVIHTVNGKAEYYGRIGELEKQAGSGFFRPHRAYLINLKYVSKYNSEEIFLENGRTLISKKKYPEFVKKYLEYLKSEGNDDRS